MPEPSASETSSAESLAPRSNPVQELWLVWRQGHRANVREFLDRAGELTPPQVAAVLLVDQRERWLIGERILAENYLALFPALLADLEYGVELVYGEYLLREELGQGPTLAEYLERFPQYARRLREQLELHHVLEVASSPGARQSMLALESMSPAIINDLPVSPPADSRWPAPRGYEILGKLGRGGMGVVYRARQRNAHRLVALKMILADADAAPEVLARFRTEIEAVARLQHPNIVQIHEVGEHDGRPYFSMEFADDGSLAQKLAGIPVPFRRAAELLETLARAIHYSHERGVLHRDLTPSNVLLMADGTPKVTDFGLAKILLGELGVSTPRGQTQSGAILGTPSYMPPEQAAGRSKEIGPAGDVYALGAILYEMLTGRPPFRAESPLETLRQVLSTEPVPPSRLQPGLPRDLVTVCLKCLAKEPLKRYASALSLAEDLHRFLEGKPIQARRAGLPERGWRWCRRNPGLAGLLSFSLGLLVLLTFGFLTAAVLFKNQRDAARNAESEKTEELCRSYLAQVRAGRLAGEAGQRFDGLAAIRRVIGLVGAANLRPEQILDLRNEAIACLASRDLRTVQEQASGLDYDFGGYAIDPMLARYTYADYNDRHLVIRRLADNAVLARLPPPPGLKFWYVSAQFSPDGRFLVVYYLNEDERNWCAVWDLPTETVVCQIEVAGYPEIRPDSHALAAASKDGTIALYSLPDGGEIRRFGHDLFPHHLSFDPGGHQLACCTSKGFALRVFDIDSAEEKASFVHPAGVYSSAWSRDGRTLAVGCEDRLIYVYNVALKYLQTVLRGHRADVLGVQFSPVGDLLASTSWDNTTRLWDPVSSQQLVSMAGNFLRFSPDGRRLGFKKHATFGIWEADDGRVCRTLHPGRVGNRAPWRRDPATRGVDFSADGRFLASAGRDGVRLWDTATGEEIDHLGAQGPVDTVQFDPRDEGFITHGAAGLYYWPVHPVGPPKLRGRSRVGPPRAWHQPGYTDWARTCWDRHGRYVAFTDKPNHRALVLNRDQPSAKVELKDCYRIISIALSPDGKWAAAAAWKDPRVHLWNATTGKSEAPLRDTGRDVYAYSAVFSPDGHWLVVGSATGYRWWQVDSWKPGLKIDNSQREGGPSPMAFARDIPLLALAVAPQTVRLVHPVTGRELATLTAPVRDVIASLCFSPDGNQLAAAMENHIHLWDLRFLRRQLGEISLDWDLPASSSPAHATDAEPPKNTVDLGDLPKTPGKARIP